MRRLATLPATTAVGGAVQRFQRVLLCVELRAAEVRHDLDDHATDGVVRRVGPLRCDERPVRRILGALGDPPLHVVQDLFGPDQIDGLAQQAHAFLRSPFPAERLARLAPAIGRDGLELARGAVGHAPV